MNMDSIRRTSNNGDGNDQEVVRVTEELLALLPEDVRTELNNGTINVHDPAFIHGLVDHLQRTPHATNVNIARTLREVQKKLRAIALAEDPNARVTEKVRRTDARVGRNDKCPCGSGRKYKQCCLRKQK